VRAYTEMTITDQDTRSLISQEGIEQELKRLQKHTIQVHYPQNKNKIKELAKKASPFYNPKYFDQRFHMGNFLPPREYTPESCNHETESSLTFQEGDKSKTAFKPEPNSAIRSRSTLQNNRSKDGERDN